MSTLAVRSTTYLAGHVTPPSSKSHSIRALFIALLCHGTSRIHNLLRATDTITAQALCQVLGAQISEDTAMSGQDAALQHSPLSCTIPSIPCTLYSPGLPLQPVSTHLCVGNSGLSACFLLPLLGLIQHPTSAITVDSSPQLRQRPIHPLIQTLNQLGLTIRYLAKTEQFPVQVSGQLRGGKVMVSGMTSQYTSALLLTLPCATQDSIVMVERLQERPYVTMTCAWLRQYHIAFEHQSHHQQDIFYIQGNQHYAAREVWIANDFSSAAYLIAASVLIKSDVTIHGLSMEDTQGDKILIDLLQRMGAEFTITATTLSIRGQHTLTGIEIAAGDIPDLLPILAVIGTQAHGRTLITQVAHARMKETDRIHAIVDGLTRMGAQLTEHPDGVCVQYSPVLRGALLRGYQDHRTVMALAVAGMLAQGTTMIADYLAVDKTFPTFLTTMQQLGANMAMCE